MAASRSSSAGPIAGPVRRARPGRHPPERVFGLLVPQRGVPARPAREDPHAAARVAEHEADRPLLVQVLAIDGLAVTLDRGPVVDARCALQRRDEGHLGGLDDAAQADLAGGHRGDRRGARAADARGRPVAAEAAPQQGQAGQDAGTGRGQDLGRRELLHGRHRTGRRRWSAGSSAAARPCASLGRSRPGRHPEVADAAERLARASPVQGLDGAQGHRGHRARARRPRRRRRPGLLDRVGRRPRGALHGVRADRRRPAPDRGPGQRARWRARGPRASSSAGTACRSASWPWRWPIATACSASRSRARSSRAPTRTPTPSPPSPSSCSRPSMAGRSRRPPSRRRPAKAAAGKAAGGARGGRAAKAPLSLPAPRDDRS